jgi:RHS repeat-associated protein
MVSRKLIPAILCLLAAVGQLNLAAQENPNLDVGFRPFGSYEGGDFDTVAFGTRTVSIFTPIASWPQRGSQLKSSLNLLYNNKAWGVHETCNLQTGACTFDWRWQYPATNPRPKGTVQLIVSTGNVTSTLRNVKGPTGQNVVLYSAVTEDGATHPLNPSGTSAAGMESIDATGIWFGGDVSYAPYTTTLIDKRGVVSGTVNGVQDTNGNYITLPSGNLPVIDSLGRNLPSSTSATDTIGCPSNPNTTNLTAGITNYPGYNGGNLIVKSCYATYSLKTKFHLESCDPTNECGFATEYTGSSSMLVGVILYNGVDWAHSPSWSFDYYSPDPNDSTVNYGDLTKVTLPTGGTITYTWTTDNLCSQLAAEVTPGSRVLKSRTVDANDGTGPHTTTYTYNSSPAPGVVVTDPAGNDTVHGFAFYGSSYETQTQYYKGSKTTGTLLKTIGTDYQVLPNPFQIYSDCPSAPELPSRVTTTLPNGSGTLVSKIETDYNTYSGNLIEKREYDYGSGAPGSLIRKTDYTYTGANANYLNANVLGPVTQETVYNGAGTKIEQTTNTYDGTTLQSSGVTMHHNTVANPGYRGNLTLVQNWLNTTGAQVTTKQTSYFDTGMPYQSKDLKNNPTTYAYDSAYDGAYLTQTQFPGTGNSITHSISGAYDFNTGKLTSFTDQNGQISTYGYDSLWRVYSASFPDGGSVGVTYTDSNPVQITKTVAVNSTLNKWFNTIFDGLGRISQTQMKDPDCTIGSALVKVDRAYGFDTTQNTTYSTVTTPYCDTPGTIYGLSTRSDADALGRPIKVTQTDGSTVTTSYSANCTTVTDEANKSRQSCTDGLGRMTGVWEDPSTLNYRTDYTYDVMNKLLSTAQRGGDPNSSDWRQRTFIYDSLSRLTNASNPESGTLSYTYSNTSSGCSGDAGAVCTKVAPAPNALSPSTATVTTTYSYDKLNRLTQKSYTDSGTTPTVSFGYDADTSTLTCSNQPTLTDSYPKGKQTAMCDGSGATSWSHDKMGRVLTEKRMINASTALTNSTMYAYNLDGSLATLTYPSSRIITYAPSSSNGFTAGRPVSAVDSAHSLNFVTNATYAPQGAIASFKNGASITGILTYNPRLQPWELYYTNGSTPAPASSLQQSTCPSLPSGQVATIMHRAYDFHAGTDSGNVYTINNCLASDRTQNFDYDNLNRIVDAYTTGTTSASKHWGGTFSIDPWGNLYSVGPYTGHVNQPPGPATTATTKNQLVGLGHDIAGNVVQNGSASYTYDDENRITNTAGVSYRYDANGERVIKCTGTYPSCSSATLYWKGTGSDALVETSWTGAINSEYVFVNGKRVARRDSSGSVYYYFSDHLGTADVITNSGGTTQKESDYYPYGGEVPITGSSFANNYKFTGKERDGESGLDNFGARYDASSLGRFMTPDPVSATPLHIINPQRWNMYSYVMNNPLTYVDPDGKDAIAVNVMNEVPFGGHEGIIVVHADGSATYARFGPQHAASPADQGKVTVQPLSPVAFREDGLPTVESYKQLSDEVAKIEREASNTVGFNYFKTSEADSIALDNWMQDWKNHPAPDYQVNTQNCATFCIAGLTKAGVLGDGQKLGWGATIPNRLFMILAGLSAENYADGQRSKTKEKVTTKIVGCTDMQGNPCKQ